MDEETVRRAIADHESALIGYACQYLRDGERARDVVQDTFIRLYQQSPEKVSRGVKTWLFTVCRNRCLDVLRKERRLVELEDEKAVTLAAEGRTPAQRVDLVERVDELKAFMEDLSDNQREVILLKFERGLSYAEISEVTKLSSGNVGFILHTGLKKLRGLLPADFLQDLSTAS